jgi:hypothetical protein
LPNFGASGNKETGKEKYSERPSIGDKLQKLNEQRQGKGTPTQQRAEYERG